MPLEYNGDFYIFIEKYLDDYIKEVTDPGLGSIFNKANLDKLNSIIEGIKNGVQEYYKGHPAKAFNDFKSGLDAIEMELSAINDSQTLNDFYRLRIDGTGTSHSFSREQMFHIPFELRSLVTTQRFSIPGLPSIYLGSTMYVCWEEMNRPNFKNVKASLYRKKDNLAIVDLGLHPLYMIKYLGDQNEKDPADAVNELIVYLILWPLIAASSVKVNNREHPFKPEYIIPQLLLQYVTRSEKIDGIRYLSVQTSPKPQNFWLYHNYVFPAKTLSPKGYCNKLNQLFSLTPGVSWQIFEIHKTASGLPSGEGPLHNYRLNFDPHTPPINYGQTDFGRFERFLDETNSLGDII